MRKLLIVLIITTLLAVTLGVLIGAFNYYYGPGYVVFSFAEYTIETSFTFMTGAVLLAFFLLYYILRLMSRLFRVPVYVSRMHGQRKSERAKNSLVKGLIEMSEGRFSQAEKMFLKQVSHSDAALLNYLMAARAAQQLGEYGRRDEYLRLAHESTPSADIAIGLTQAELQLSHKQFEQALATLNHLSSVSPKHAYVKRLQTRVYQQLGDWDSLGIALEEAKKLKALDDERYQELELQAYTGMLKNSIKQVDGEKTEQIWKKLPKQLKSSAELLFLYGSYLKQQSKDNEAESLIRNHLNTRWSEELAQLYCELNVTDPKKQFETAETWLHNQPRNAWLLLVLGKLSMKCQYWGKARNYLETSISVKPLSEAYLKLAQLLEEKMDEHEEAEKYYRQGLRIAVDEQSASVQHLLKAGSDKASRPLLKIIQ